MQVTNSLKYTRGESLITVHERKQETGGVQKNATTSNSLIFVIPIFTVFVVVVNYVAVAEVADFVNVVYP